MIRLFSILLITITSQTAWAGECPQWLAHEMRRLHSTEVIDLCERYAGRPLLIVNTASHCGFTPQFEDLEKLHKTYGERGLAVLGFPSDDFRQAAATEADAANVCYVNYGVSFDMFSPIAVTGANAHPVFRELAAGAMEPGWNFFKYVVDRDGNVLRGFTSRTTPADPELHAAIEQALRDSN